MRSTRAYAFATILLAALLLVPTMAVAADAPLVMSPAEVVEIDRDLDGTTLVVEGEAVGDVLRAPGGGRWVNVLGDEVGLGIWMTEEMADTITHLGYYKHDGDMVRVTGTLNVTCEQHSGEFDVHADTLEILSVGEPRVHEPRIERLVIGVVGLALALGLYVRYRSVRD